MKRYSHQSTGGHAPAYLRFFDHAYPVIRRVAGARAGAAAKSWGLSDDKRADFEQDAAMQVWRKLGAFDSSRSSLKTFIEHIVASQLSSSVRRLRAKKRQALSDYVTNPCPSLEIDRLNFRIDVQRVVDGLPLNQRNICRMLADYSVTEISQREGIPRATIYRLISHLRTVFINAGLHRSSKSGAGC
jgi:RNA polymerase sigma factor (sigma-70 family)